MSPRSQLARAALVDLERVSGRLSRQTWMATYAKALAECLLATDELLGTSSKATADALEALVGIGMVGGKLVRELASYRKDRNGALLAVQVDRLADELLKIVRDAGERIAGPQQKAPDLASMPVDPTKN